MMKNTIEKRLNLSLHITKDRLERATSIMLKYGKGETIAKKYNEKQKRWLYLQDNGVVWIVNKDEDTLITLYVANVAQATYIYRAQHQGAMPKSLYKNLKK